MKRNDFIVLSILIVFAVAIGLWFMHYVSKDKPETNTQAIDSLKTRLNIIAGQNIELTRRIAEIDSFSAIKLQQLELNDQRLKNELKRVYFRGNSDRHRFIDSVFAK